MNRRDFLRATGATALSAGLATAAPATVPSTAPATTRPAVPFTVASAPVLLYPTPDSVTVAWSVTAPGTGWVEYGTTESLGQRAVGNDGGLLPFSERLLSVRLTDLRPGTRYFYRVHSSPVNFQSAYHIRRGTAVHSTDVRSFTTPDPAAAECRFTVWNDTHERADTLAKLADTLAAAAGPTDFLFWNGDIANQIETEDEIVTKYLDPIGRPFADQVPVLYSRGNHDVRGRAARHLPASLSFPDRNPYFAFRQGPVAFIALDTGEDKPDDHPAYAGLAGFNAYREEQRRWLETAVRHPSVTSAAFKVVFAHIPLVWDSPLFERWERRQGGHRNWVCDDGLERWGPLLKSSGVNLIVSGHTHAHAYFPPNASHPWAQLVGGGPQLNAATALTAHATSTTLDLTLTLVGTGQVAVRQTLTRNG